MGVESTILDLSVTPPRVLRPGGVTLEQLRRLLPETEMDPGLVKPDETLKAPGMKYRHYAPHAGVTVLTGPGEVTAEYIRAHCTPRSGVICFDEYAPLFEGLEVHLLGPEGDKGSRPAGCLTPCGNLTTQGSRKSTPSARTRGDWAWPLETG